MRYEAVLPGEKCATVTFVLSSPTNLAMGLPIGLNSVFLGALVTLPLLLAMLSAIVLLYPCQVPQGS